MPAGHQRRGREPGPTESTWRDTGCELHPACLSCPLVLCVEDLGGVKAYLRQEGARAQAPRWPAAAAPETVADRAARMGISARTYYRRRWRAIGGKRLNRVTLPTDAGGFRCPGCAAVWVRTDQCWMVERVAPSFAVASSDSEGWFGCCDNEFRWEEEVPA